MSLILSLALASAAPAEIIPVKAEKAETAKEKRNKIICKRQPPPAGTRLGGKKVCATQAEWDLARKENEEALRRASQKGYQEGGLGGGLQGKGD